MKRLIPFFAMIALCGSAAAASATGASTAETGSGKNPQQEKMASCNKDASGKKGEERKAFMKECLSGKPEASEAQLAQRGKMKDCNAQAKDKKGEERKSFMKTCLSSDASATGTETKQASDKQTDKSANPAQPAKK